METWTYLLIFLISFTCTQALPARTDDAQKQEHSQDDRLLFESQQGANSNQGQGATQGQGQEAVPVQGQGQEAAPALGQGQAAVPAEGQGQEAAPALGQGQEDTPGLGQGQKAAAAQGQRDANLMRQAVEQKIGRDAPANHGEIGSQTGDEIVHGEDGASHGETQEQQQQETKHAADGVLNEDFVHNLMHEGEDHEEEDDRIRKGRPADLRDVSKMKFTEEELKGLNKELLKDPNEGEPEYEDQENGPIEPNKQLHGVLMHGDEEAGKDHKHEEEAKMPEVTGDTSVVVGQVGQAGDDSEVKKIADAPPITLDAEILIHGEGDDHTHEKEVKVKDKESGSVGTVLTENFMHNLMHGNSDNHDHDDEDLKKTKAIRPRDLLNLGLDEQMLKGIDLVKMIKEDMEDYNKYMAEKGGDEESVWNIFNSFQFRYFKYGEDIDDISSRGPPQEEWDESVTSRLAQHEGEDSIDHMMEGIGNDGSVHDVHNLNLRRKAEREANEKP